MMASLAGPKTRREPAGEAKPNVCVISDGKARAYCTVGLVSDILISTFSLCPVQHLQLTVAMVRALLVMKFFKMGHTGIMKYGGTILNIIIII